MQALYSLLHYLLLIFYILIMVKTGIEYKIFYKVGMENSDSHKP